MYMINYIWNNENYPSYRKIYKTRLYRSKKSFLKWFNFGLQNQCYTLQAFVLKGDTWVLLTQEEIDANL